MNKKASGILLGIFFILAGTLFMFRNVLPFDYTYLMTAVAGIELLVLHFFTDGLLSVILGSYLSYWGILHLFNLENLLATAFAASAIFFIPAIIFFILFIRQQKRGYLTWLCLFTLLGIDTLLNQLTGIDPIGALFICIGIALILDYIIGRTYAYTSRLQAGILFVVVGMLKMTDWNVYVNYLIPAALIWLGIIVFVKALTK
ncbi:MAG: hypothetical protein IJR45_06995 [Firmicutes bacterium]|nr:hypothetical protein [Bacillota bacterium]